MSLVDTVHDGYVLDRRARLLSHYLTPLLPERSRVLDVGCGDCRIAWLITQARPDLTFHGVDTLVRGTTWMSVEEYDGRRLPYGDKSTDVVMLVDVLHHADDPSHLLKEGARVAIRNLVIKDHTRDGLLANTTLKLMDRVGNLRHGVALPYNYWPKRVWLDRFREGGLALEYWNQHLHLYPWPATWVFDRSLHFVAKLSVRGVA